MADVPVLNAAPEAEAAPKSKKWLIIGVIAFLAITGGGVGAWLAFGHDDTHGKKAAEKSKEPLAPPLYVALDPPFVVNFEAKGMMRFLQVSIEVMTRDPATADLLKLHDPMLRNELLLLLGNQTYEMISTREGKEQLRGQALEAVAKIIGEQGGNAKNVEQLYFTSFVMQ